MKKIMFMLSVTTMLSACSMVPEYMRPEVSMPQGWNGAEVDSTSHTIEKEWWTQFGSAELNTLVPEALEHNNDMRASLARIEQLRAALTIAGAPLLPQIGATGSASQSDTSRSNAEESYRAGAGISYELDIFGRNRALRESAQQGLIGGEFDRQALALMVVNDVASGYFQVLTLQERLTIAEQNLARAEDVFRVIEAQYNEGRISGLEQAQQKVELASTRAQLSSIRNQTTVAQNALAVLLGKAPQEFAVQAKTLAGVNAPVITPTLPARLIEQRPDIQSAEAALRAANANIGVARANMYPRLTLSADATAFANPSYTATSLAAALAAPIFQGGSLKGEVDRRTAQRDELVETYRKAVLTAFREVEDALASLKAAGERQEYFLEAAKEADRAYDIAKEQFEAGAIDFQTLLIAQRAQLSASDSFAQSKLELLSASISLLRALGGGWQV
jgi:NodT family efflux transporter outer membrane factor (OMF) lipoprotein